MNDDKIYIRNEKSSKYIRTLCSRGKVRFVGWVEFNGEEFYKYIIVSPGVKNLIKNNLNKFKGEVITDNDNSFKVGKIIYCLSDRYFNKPIDKAINIDRNSENIKKLDSLIKTCDFISEKLEEINIDKEKDSSK